MAPDSKNDHLIETKTTSLDAFDFVYEKLGRHVSPDALKEKSLGQSASKYMQWSNAAKGFVPLKFSQTGGLVVVDSGNTASVLGNFEDAEVGPVSLHCVRDEFMGAKRSPLGHVVNWINEGRLVFPFVLIELGQRLITSEQVKWSLTPKQINLCSSKEPKSFNLDLVNVALSLVAKTGLDVKSTQSLLFAWQSYHFPTRPDDVERAVKDLKKIEAKYPAMTFELGAELYSLIKPMSGDSAALFQLMNS